MSIASFQRARKPEERELRRVALLVAAAELFDAEGPQGAGLNAIAARAGFTKSNVYRYFESREEVLISLFLDEFGRMVPEVEAGFAACASGDIDALAEAATGAFASRPRLCRLMGILTTVLEENVSVSSVLTLKTAIRDFALRIAVAMQSRMPDSSIEDCGWVASMVGTIVAGLWPASHPSPAAAEVLARPEFAGLKPNLQHDLKRAAVALLRSIARG